MKTITAINATNTSEVIIIAEGQLSPSLQAMMQASVKTPSSKIATMSAAE